MANLLDAHSLSAETILSLVAEAQTIKNTLEHRDIKKLPTLRGKTIITAFYENSTRTRVSFETAGKWLSADVINVSSTGSSVAKGESLEDTALTLSAIGADALVVRHPQSGAVSQIAGWLHQAGYNPAVINAGDGLHEHPTQALLDTMTILEHFPSIEGLNIVIVGDIVHSRVARSNIAILATLGANITLIAPDTLLPIGVESWPQVTVSHHLDAFLPTADVIMMLRVQQERMNGGFYPSAKEYSTLYGLNEQRVNLLPAEAIIMHPGPMLRGMEIGYLPASSSQTYVLDQVKNGVYMRMAILYRCLFGAEPPALPAPGVVPQFPPLSTSAEVTL